MFTIREISELAVQIESNGEALYREVASKTNDPDLKNLLEQLAQEEAQHARWFSRLGEDPLAGGRNTDDEMEAMGRELLAQMLGEQTFSLDVDSLNNAITVSQIIEQAAEFEQDTIVFYQMLADFVEAGPVSDHLTAIIAEENTHVEKLRHYLQPERSHSSSSRCV